MTDPKRLRTRLVLSYRGLQITLTIWSPLPMVYRRQIALELFRAIKTTLRGISSAHIGHSDGHVLNVLNETSRALSSRGASVGNENPGLRYRLRRQELGLTLRKASEVLDMDYSLLSRVERGKFKLSSKSLFKLERFLFSDFNSTKSTSDKS